MSLNPASPNLIVLSDECVEQIQRIKILGGFVECQQVIMNALALYEQDLLEERSRLDAGVREDRA